MGGGKGRCGEWCGEVLRRGVGECMGECDEYGEACWGVGKGLEGVGESERKCAGVWGEVRRGVGNVGKCWGRCGKVCWGVGKIKGNEEKSVGGMGKVWQSVLGVGGHGERCGGVW